MSVAALSRARALLQPRRRRAAEHFLAEGGHVIEELLRGGLVPREAFAVATGLRPDAAALVEVLRARDVPVHEVDDRALREIAGTRTPQGLVAVVPEPAAPDQPFARGGLWLLLDRIQDPGNAGTLLRAAEAFGCAGVLALAGTVDLWSGKTVRAGQGAHAHLVVLQDGPRRSADADLAAFVAAGGELWAAETGGADVYDAPLTPRLCMLAVGNESGGLAPGIAGRATRRIAVPQRGRTESLNVAMAGTVLLSWLARQAR